MDTAINNFKRQHFMDTLRKTTVDPGIRSHLDTSMATRPILRGCQQLRTQASSAQAFPHKPAFHETHWLPRIATIRMRTQADFEKTGERSICCFRNEDH